MPARRKLRLLMVIGALGAVALPACGGSGSAGQGTAVGQGTPAGQSPAASAGVGSRGFPAVPKVDNRMFPLVPGTRFSYQGTLVADGSAAGHSVVFTVTDLTKMVAGVRTVVALDQDFLNGRLQEQELAFFAQDASGNVWNYGEYPEEYTHGRFTGAPDTWINGTGGAHGGIHMLARPAPGAQYTEGRVPAIEFYDVSRVIRTSSVSCGSAPCPRNVLVVDEWSPNDPAGGHQIKYYAPGVGLIRVGARGGDSQEYLHLVAVSHLGPSATVRVRAAALAMEARAYRVSAVYRTTPHATASHR